MPILCRYSTCGWVGGWVGACVRACVNQGVELLVYEALSY
jgi:hypothetical protein